MRINLDELAKQQEQDDSESRQVDPRLPKLQQLYDKRAISSLISDIMLLS